MVQRTIGRSPKAFPDKEVLDFWMSAAQQGCAGRWVRKRPPNGFKANASYSSPRCPTVHQQSDICPPVSVTKGARQGGDSKTLGYFRYQPQSHELLPLARMANPIGSGEVEAANKVLTDPAPGSDSAVGMGKSGAFFSPSATQSIAMTELGP